MYTGWCLLSPQGVCRGVCRTDVTFKPLSDAFIAAYVASGAPLDKAGGYGIQGLAGLFIDRIEGSYSGIMGLPVFETAQLLAEVAPQLLPDCALTGR